MESFLVAAFKKKVQRLFGGKHDRRAPLGLVTNNINFLQVLAATLHSQS